MFGKLARSVSSLFGGGEVERWTPAKLAEVKYYLENKPPELLTREDHYLMIDFLFHRYFPKDSPITKAAWDKRQSELRAKIDWNIAHPEEVKALREAQLTGAVEVPEDPEFSEWLKKTLRD